MIICRCDLADAVDPVSRWNETYERRWRLGETRDYERPVPSKDAATKTTKWKKKKTKKEMRTRRKKKKKKERETCFFVEAETNSHCLRRATAVRALRSIYHLLITIIPLAPPLPSQHPPQRSPSSCLYLSFFFLFHFLAMSFTMRALPESETSSPSTRRGTFSLASRPRCQ